MKTYNKILAAILVALVSAQGKAADDGTPNPASQIPSKPQLSNAGSDGNGAQSTDARSIPGLAQALMQPAPGDPEGKGAAAAARTEADEYAEFLHTGIPQNDDHRRRVKFDKEVARFLPSEETFQSLSPELQASAIRRAQEFLQQKEAQEELQRLRARKGEFEAGHAHITNRLQKAAAAGKLRAWNNNPDKNPDNGSASDKANQHQSFRHLVDAAIAAHLKEQASKGISSSSLEKNIRKALDAYIQQQALDKMGPSMPERILTKGFELGATQAVAELSHQGATFALDKAAIPFKKLYEKATSTEEEFKLKQELVEEKQRAQIADLKIELLTKRVTRLDKEAKAELLAEALKEAEAAMEEAFAARKEDDQKPDEADGLQPVAESDDKL